MSPTEAMDLVAQAQELLQQVCDEYPCERCDGLGEDYPGHHYAPCYECNGTGYQIPDEEDE